MKEIDRTFEALKHLYSFEEVMNQTYIANPGGSYTFSRANSNDVWRVSADLEYICVDNGWTVEEFNLKVNEHFNDKAYCRF